MKSAETIMFAPATKMPDMPTYTNGRVSVQIQIRPTVLNVKPILERGERACACVSVRMRVYVCSAQPPTVPQNRMGGTAREQMR